MTYKAMPFSIFRRMFIAGVFCLFGLLALPISFVSAQSTAYVRVIHASPFVGTADVFVDGQKLLSSFQFAAVTGYVPVPDGAHKVQIALVGKGIGASVLSEDLTIQPGYSYTLAALGTSEGALSLKAFVDNNDVAPDRAKVRVYHLSPNAGDATVSVGDDTKLDNMSYQDASDYVTVDSGPCTFDFIDQTFHTTLPLSTNLAANTVTSIFAVGLFQGNPGVQLVSAQTAGIPGMPSTGSDPNVNPLDSVVVEPSSTWLFLLVAFALAGMSVTVLHVRRKS